MIVRTCPEVRVHPHTLFETKDVEGDCAADNQHRAEHTDDVEHINHGIHAYYDVVEVPQQ